MAATPPCLPYPPSNLMYPAQTLTIPAHHDHIQHLTNFVLQAARQANFNEQAQFHFELICDEVCANIIEHAYQNQPDKQIVVTITTTPHTLILTFQDNGRSFNPQTIPPPDNDNLTPSGRGLHIIRQLVDQCDFTTTPHHNTLTLTKKRP
ncbi:MAG TPA: ATP-binding protein [Anaerolineae bacterium]|nr:ATP-binding protein [Anaerolineae bacterium]